MTDELMDRMIGNLRRVCSRLSRVTDDVTQAGGLLVGGVRWGREAQIRAMLESKAAECRNIADLLQGQAELIDEPSKERGAA